MTEEGRPLTAVYGIVILGVVVSALVIGPALYDRPPNDQDLMATLLRPSWDHPFGTDQYGRDVLARVLHGGRISLSTSAAIVATTLVLGFLVGWIAAGESVIARLVTRAVDVALSLPSTIVALSVVGALGIGMRNLYIAFVLVGWPFYARVVRGLANERMKGLDVHAATAHGVSGWRIFSGHVVPHLIRTLAIVAALDLGYTLSALAGFSYLGLGAQAPTAEWGSMLKDAQVYVTIAPFFLIGPSLGIGLTVLGTTLLTEHAHSRGVR